MAFFPHNTTALGAWIKLTFSDRTSKHITTGFLFLKSVVELYL